MNKDPFYKRAEFWGFLVSLLILLCTFAGGYAVLSYRVSAQERVNEDMWKAVGSAKADAQSAKDAVQKTDIAIAGLSATLSAMQGQLNRIEAAVEARQWPSKP